MNESAIAYIAKQLRTGTAITIHPYDDMTGTIMVEGHSTNFDDIRTRKEVTIELLQRGMGNIDEELVEETIREVEHAANVIRDYNEHKNAERNRLRKEDFENHKLSP